MSPPSRCDHARRLALLLLIPLCSCAPPVRVPLTPSPPPEDAPASENTTGLWWAVRLGTREEPARAYDAASEAAPRFDEPVEVVSLGGQWHVQVGTFRTEEQARALAALARARGYRSAAVVPAHAPQPASEGLAVPREESGR